MQVLVEGPARRDSTSLTGRTCTNKRVIIQGAAEALVPASYAPAKGLGSSPAGVHLAPGDYVAVEVRSAGTITLEAAALARTTLREFVGVHGATFSPPGMSWHEPGDLGFGAAGLERDGAQQSFAFAGV
jgi:hypothetical protein